MAVAASIVLLGAAAGARATTRQRTDAHDVARLTAQHPAALARLEQGETLALAGDLSGALSAFREAGAAAPESALVARRECQALTLLGARVEAIQSCLRALRNEGSAMDMRATVAALMSGNELPTPGELSQAVRLARRARDTMPREPWGYAAECDIARRVGDAQMLEGCVKELQRIAPAHEETTRALALAAPWGATWRVAWGWAAILLVSLGTLVHALVHAARPFLGRRRAGLVAGALFLVLELAGARPALADAAAPPAEKAPSAHAGLLSDWAVDDKDPEGSIPDEKKRNRNPLQFGYWLMDLAWKGSEATKRGDHPAAVRFYRALAKAVPDRAVSFTRLCEAYEAAGDWKSALEACATALTVTGGTVRDYARYVQVALGKKGTLEPAEIEVLNGVLQHLREDPAGRDTVDDLDCRIAVRIEDTKRLQACTAALAIKAPDDPKTLSYQWALAIAQSDFARAEDLLARARETDMEPEGLEQMQRGIEVSQAARRHKRYAWAAGGAFVVMMAGAVFVMMRSRRKTLSAA